MFTADNVIRVRDLQKGQIILFDGHYQVVHKVTRWATEADLHVNAIDNLNSATRIELISLPNELRVVTFNFPHLMQ